MKTLRVIVSSGMILLLGVSCARSPLDVFLTPNPNLQNAGTQREFVPEPQPVVVRTFAPAPEQQVRVLEAPTPYYVQTVPTETVVYVESTLSPPLDMPIPMDTGTGTERIAAQMSEALAEAQAHVRSGEARLQERNPIEAIREFERARTLLEQGVDPSLQYIQQAQTIQGGVNILGAQRIQSIQIQRSELLSRINRSYDFKTLYLKQKEADQLETLRAQNQPALQPVSLDRNWKQPKTQVKTSLQASRAPRAFVMSPRSLPAGSVDRYIARFQQRRSEFRACLLRANQHFPMVTSLLASSGVPADLAYVALIESGFQPRIAASSGKAGLWQLSAATARAYGLTVNSQRDDRQNLQAATRAFARYISDLRGRFGSWDAALLAYEPDNQFLVKLDAATAIANNPRAYGFDVDLPNISGQITAWAQ